MKLESLGETFQSVVGLSKTNLLLKNYSDLLQEGEVNISGEWIFFAKVVMKLKKTLGAHEQTGVDIQQVLCTFTKIQGNNFTYAANLNQTTWRVFHLMRFLFTVS